MESNFNATGDQNTQVGGDYTHVEGDYNNNSYNYGDKAEVSPLIIDGYDEKHYPPPQCSKQLTTQLLQHNFAIIFGNVEIQLPLLSKHIAFRIKQLNPQLEVYELRRAPGDSRYLSETLRKLPQPSILVVDDLVPLDVLSDPIGIADLAKSLGHYVISNTLLAQDKWGLNPAVFQQIWFEIPNTDLYAPALLERLLLQAIDDKNILFDDSWDAIAREAACAKAALKLKTPSRISSFVHMLLTESRPITPSRFEDILEDASSAIDALISRWYHRADEKQKMLLLAATLFQGLDEKQFFDNLDLLIDQRWQFRVKALKAVDYCDLEEIQEFSEFLQKNNDTILLSSKIPGQELEILKTSMRGYRRHVIASVPIIVNAITATVGTGNIAPSIRLRSVLGLSLSRLAILMPDEILPELQTFAGASMVYRRVAAQAMVAWRKMGYFEQMLYVVDDWLKPGENKVAIRYTALMALAFAADQDIPNQLDPEILIRIKSAMQDRSVTVQKFIDDLIPRLLGNHPLQVAPMMLDDALRERYIERKKDLIDPVAKGLANALRTYPEPILSFLNDQLNGCIADIAETGKSVRESHRDRKLVAILETFLYVDFDNIAPFLSPQTILKEIAALRPKESQAFVRGSIMEVILHLLQQSGSLDQKIWEQLIADSIFAERIQLIRKLGDMIASGQIQVARPYMEMLLKDLANGDYTLRIEMLNTLIEFWPKHYASNPDECMEFMAKCLHLYPNSDRIYFAQVIGQIYLNCRENLTGGTFSIEVEGRTIPVFINRRPQTTIEQHMLWWLQSPSRHQGKTALLAWMEFGSILEIRERTEIANWRPSAQPASTDEQSAAEAEARRNAEHSAAQNQSRHLVPFHQTVRIPLRVKILGCFAVGLVASPEKRLFWQAIHTIYGRPGRYDGESVKHAILRLNISDQNLVQNLGKRLLRLRTWLMLFNSNW